MTDTATTHLYQALRLHRAVQPDPARGGCVSPLSITAALGLAAEATAGDTRAELLTALGEPDLDRLRADLRAAATVDGAELALTDTVWADESVELAADFRERLAGWPGAAAHPAPLRAAPERARAMINDAVAEDTRGLIDELVPSGGIDASSAAALVNALYLSASWKTPFPDRATRPEPFADLGPVPTMRVRGEFGYAADHDWQAVLLPAGPDVEAVVLVPRDALVAAEPALTAARLETLLAATNPSTVELHLPRLRVRGGGALRGALTDLGVHRLWTPDADFAPMTRAAVHVADMWHESVLRLDEHGFEGAAATAVLVRLAMATAGDPVRVRADRPFLLLVRHRHTGGVYFLARVTDPGAAG